MMTEPETNKEPPVVAERGSKSHLVHTALAALIAGGGGYALSEYLNRRKAHTQHPWDAAAAAGADKMAMENTMDIMQLIRRLKSVVGTRGGARLLRILEARLAIDRRRRAAKDAKDS